MEVIVMLMTIVFIVLAVALLSVRSVWWRLLPKSIPKEYRISAVEQWLSILPMLFVHYIINIIVAPFVIWTGKNTTNFVGEVSQLHDQKYMDEGASGVWRYRATDVKCLDGYNNYEDGLYGEPSGKHSARCNGNERTFWSQFKWLLRNPANKLKRTSDKYACFVNDCRLVHWGKDKLSDKTASEDTKGWYFVCAVNTITGKEYYCYRSVKNAGEGKVKQSFVGFKIKPEHDNEVQDDDDLDKAFSVRLPFKTSID